MRACFITMCMCARNPTSLIPQLPLFGSDLRAHSHLDILLLPHIHPQLKANRIQTEVLRQCLLVSRHFHNCNALRSHQHLFPGCGKSLSFSHGDGPSSCLRGGRIVATYPKLLLVFLLFSSQIPSMGDKCEISRNSAIEHNFPGPARLFQDKLDFSNVAE